VVHCVLFLTGDKYSFFSFGWCPWNGFIEKKDDLYHHFNLDCPQAGQAFTFFLQQKKVNKKCRRYRRKPKNCHIRLKSSNSLRSNSDDFFTPNMTIF
jgi:hypothetical protein